MRFTILLILGLWINNCGSGTPPTKPNENPQSGSGQTAGSQTPDSSPNTNSASPIPSPATTENQTNQPKTVREFFNLLPEKYFVLEGCHKATDKNCNKARKEYIATFLQVEDNKNAYWKSGCDGAQSCLTMTLFKRPDATYIVHILTEFEAGEDSYFLEYKGDKWTDISAKVVPEFSPKNTYIPPRQGTIVEVFKKNFPEPDFSERGEKLYDLTWNAGKFSIKK